MMLISKMPYLNYKPHGLLHYSFSSSGPVLCARGSLHCMCRSQGLTLLETCLNNTYLYDCIPSAASSGSVPGSTLTSLSSRSDLQWAALCHRWHRRSSSSGTPDPRRASLPLRQRFPAGTAHIFAKKTSCLREYIFITQIHVKTGQGCWGTLSQNNGSVFSYIFWFSVLSWNVLSLSYN